MQSAKLSLSLFTLACFMITSCEKIQEPASSNVDAYEGYILSHSPDQQGTGDPVVFLFNDGVISTEARGLTQDAILSISPKTDGNLEWTSDNVLRFSPKTTFEPGRQYILSLDMQKLVPDIPDSLKTLVHIFRTDPMIVSASFTESLQPDLDNSDNMMLGGTITFNTEVDPAKVREAVEVQYISRLKPGITWEPTGNAKTLQFRIHDIARSDAHQNLVWRLNGRSIGADHDLQYNFRIPAKGAFILNDIRLERGERTEIHINFSDFLDRNQDLRGLIRIQGNTGSFNYEVRKNNIIIFPDKGLAGGFVLLIEDAVRSTAGRTLDKSYAYNLAIEQQKPAVRLVGNGVIVPGKDQVVFPFEAINLTKVDIEIIKIFQNNVLQFLQYNSLDEDYNLNAVGRVISSETVDLTRMQPDIPIDIWSRYAFDLQEVVRMDQGAVYQVRLGFKKEYSLFPCENETVTGNVEPDEDRELKSFWTYQTGYPGFSYEHYDNPCYPAYYSYNHFIKRNILASNLGITAKSQGRNAILIYATDLLTGEARSGVDIKLYDYQQQLLSTAKTDRHGMASLPAEREAAFVVANSGSEQTYLRVSDGYSLSLSAFEVGGRSLTRNFDGFFYAERAVWRPGDSVYLNFMLDRKESGLPPDHPLDFRVFDPRGKEVHQRITHSRVIGGEIYDLYFATKTSAPTGNWRVEAEIGGATFSRLIQIETVKPNRLKILWENIEDVQGYKTASRIKLRSRWLHGAPASGLKASVNAQLNPHSGTFGKDLEGYDFHDPSRGIGLQPVQLFNASLDAEGEALISTGNIDNSTLPGPMAMRLQTRVFEPGAGFSEDYSSGILHPFSSYVGLYLPASRWGRKQMRLNVDNDVDLMVVDPSGKPLPDRELHVGLYQAEWSWWWDREDYSLTHFNSGDHHNALTRDTVVTGTDGKALWKFKPVTYGFYLLRVCDPVSGHCTGDMFYSGWGSSSEAKDAVSQLRFSTDEEKYEAGDKVTINIPASAGSKLLITVEKNDTVLISEWEESRGEIHTYTFQATEEMVPNVYVHVSLIQPHAGQENDMPVRLYGVIPVDVHNPATILKPVIDMPDELKPNGSFSLTVSEASGQAMAYTVAIVDEGLLDLTHFPTPDPHGHFYARQALRVNTWDMYDLVLTNLGGEINRIFSVGGDGAVEIDPEGKEANRFPPVVRHLGPYYLEKGEQATHEINMPNYIGSVRTMVVACNAGKFGKAEKTTPVRQPLMLLATLPRVLSPGEEFDMPVQTFVMREGIGNVSIRIETDPLLTLVDGPSQSLQFDRMGDETAFFRLRVGENEGVAHIRVTAQSGSFSASQVVEIQVANPNPVITRTSDDVVESQASVTIPLDFFGVEGSHTATLEVAAIPPLNLGDRLSYLLQYPYGCAEQITSQVFAQLYLDRVTELDEAKKQQVTANIQGAMTQLKQFQLHNGGFTFWPGNTHIALWTTSYIGHFLSEAARLGYFVDSKMLNAWATSQQKLAQQYRHGQPERHWNQRNWELQQAYRLYTLALAGHPDWASMNLFRTQFSHNTSGWLLAAAFAEAGKPDIAGQIARGLETDVVKYREYGHTYGSDLRDRAIIVRTMMVTGMEKAAAGIVRDIARALGSQQWLSTQELAFAFIAVSAYLGEEARKERNFEIVFPDGSKQAINLSAPVLFIDITNETWSGQTVTIHNNADETLFSRVSISGKPKTYQNITESRHLNMQVNYIDTKGKPVDIRRLERGMDFIAIVTLKNPGTRVSDLHELALSQVFPSGWEIQNTRLSEYGSFVQNSGYDYQDIRDDRVYTFFDLYGSQSTNTYNVLLTAAYPGVWFMPDVYCEAMYDKDVFARSAGGWVTVY